MTSARTVGAEGSPSLEVTPDEDLINCQGCGITCVQAGSLEAADTIVPISGYSLSTNAAFKKDGSSYADGSRRFVLRMCRDCATKLAISILEMEVT